MGKGLSGVRPPPKKKHRDSFAVWLLYSVSLYLSPAVGGVGGSGQQLLWGSGDFCPVTWYKDPHL